MAKNVLGTELKECGCVSEIKTGFYRDGFCNSDNFDRGLHTVCAVVSDEFLEFSKSQGNDLITKREEFDFPGLKDGDHWCLCVSRWIEAYHNNKAPKIILESTHEKTLDFVKIEVLREFEFKD